jgi:hypothetical protein
METRTSTNDFWYKTYYLVSILGFIFCLGSIFSFIVMNIVLGETPSIDSVYWQRLFVSKITEVLIIPGICLVLIAAILISWKYYGFLSNNWVILVQLLVVLIVINSINIILLSEKATEIAIHQKETMENIPEYLKNKSREDIFGGLNTLMLLATLIIPFYKLKK